MAWTAGLVVLMLVGASGTAYAMLRHFNNNIQQADITALIGKQPGGAAKGAENILFIGSGTPVYQGNQYGSQKTNQTHTLMLLHIQAQRKWGDVMSIPASSWVHIPACVMGNGKMSLPTQGPIGQSFATGNGYGNKAKLGVACLVKTVEQDTRIPIDHFVLINFNGLGAIVAALHGLRVCIPKAFTDPLTGDSFKAGCQWLTPGRAVAYAQSVYGINPADIARLTGGQQLLASLLISRAKSELYNPLVIYDFVDAVTRSLTIDTQLGGFTGLIRLAENVHSIPSHKATFFTVPYYPRSEVVPADTANVLWKQPQANRVFACIRKDIYVNRSAHCA
jgi:LCP family protein required for cell wall assembly